jgi:ATP-dependent Clp protease adaptor protein ClpS
MTRTPLATPERQVTKAREGSPYPRVRVIVLDDNVNTFEHVVRVLVRIIPGMQPDQAWTLAYQIDGEGAAVVWTGPLEQGELYHHQLAAEGLTMAPLETI